MMCRVFPTKRAIRILQSAESATTLFVFFAAVTLARIVAAIFHVPSIFMTDSRNFIHLGLIGNPQNQRILCSQVLSYSATPTTESHH
jgi:hypothetical protein